MIRVHLLLFLFLLFVDSNEPEADSSTLGNLAAAATRASIFSKCRRKTESCCKAERCRYNSLSLILEMERFDLLMSLPNELKLFVLSFVGVTYLPFVMQVCRAWRDLATNEWFLKNRAPHTLDGRFFFHRGHWNAFLLWLKSLHSLSEQLQNDVAAHSNLHRKLVSDMKYIPHCSPEFMKASDELSRLDSLLKGKRKDLCLLDRVEGWLTSNTSVLPSTFQTCAPVPETTHVAILDTFRDYVESREIFVFPDGVFDQTVVLDCILKLVSRDVAGAFSCLEQGRDFIVDELLHLMLQADLPEFYQVLVDSDLTSFGANDLNISNELSCLSYENSYPKLASLLFYKMDEEVSVQAFYSVGVETIVGWAKVIGMNLDHIFSVLWDTEDVELIQRGYAALGDHEDRRDCMDAVRRWNRFVLEFPPSALKGELLSHPSLFAEDLIDQWTAAMIELSRQGLVDWSTFCASLPRIGVVVRACEFLLDELSNEATLCFIKTILTSKSVRKKEAMAALDFAQSKGMDLAEVLAMTNLATISLTHLLRHFDPRSYERIMAAAIKARKVNCVSALLDVGFVVPEHQLEEINALGGQAGERIQRLARKSCDRIRYR